MGKFCHIAALPKITQKISIYQLLNIELVLTHTVSELGVLGIARKLSVPFVTLCKENQKIFKIFCSRDV